MCSTTLECVRLGNAFDLVVEGEEFAGFGRVHLNGLPLALDLGLIDFALALGGEVGAGSHGEGAGDHAGDACEEDELAVAEGSAGDAGDDAEDCSKAIVDAVDGVADPASGLGAAFVAAGEEFGEKGAGVGGRGSASPFLRGNCSRMRLLSSR